VQWVKVGPFTVAMGSANGLMWTLILLGLLSLTGPAALVISLAKRNPKVAAILAARQAKKHAALAQKLKDTAPPDVTPGAA
jgi:hypothetical protein